MCEVRSRKAAVAELRDALDEVVESGGTIGVSACLLGAPCRYDGESKASKVVVALVEELRVQGVGVCEVCPECMGGLPVPRDPSELLADGRVVSSSGEDRTRAFVAGSERAVRELAQAGAQLVILKAKSPSCGVHEVYDGTFSRTLRPGMGTLASRLVCAGMVVADELDVDALRG